MPSGSSPRANRAANAKTKTQTLSLAQDAEGLRSQAGSAARACVGDKVSAIRLNLMFANKVLSVAEASVWDFLAQEAPAPALEDLRETMSLAIQYVDRATAEATASSATP